MKGILPLLKNEALRAKERVRDLLAFYPTGHFVHLLSSLKRGIHFCFNTSFPSPAHLGLVSTITTAGRDGRGKSGPDLSKRTNSVCNVGQQGTSLYDGMARSQVGLSRLTVPARSESWELPIHSHCQCSEQSEPKPKSETFLCLAEKKHFTVMALQLDFRWYLHHKCTTIQSYRKKSLIITKAAFIW